MMLTILPDNLILEVDKITNMNPCCRCGETPTSLTFGFKDSTFTVLCPRCGLKLTMYTTDLLEAINMWNEKNTVYEIYIIEGEI